MTVSFLGVLPINADSLKNEEGAEVFYEDSIVSDTFVDEDLIGQIPQIAITPSSGANGESQVTSEKFTNKKQLLLHLQDSHLMDIRVVQLEVNKIEFSFLKLGVVV